MFMCVTSYNRTPERGPPKEGFVRDPASRPRNDRTPEGGFCTNVCVCVCVCCVCVVVRNPSSGVINA